MKVPNVTGENQLLSGRRALAIIDALAKSPGSTSFSQLETEIGVSAASLSRLLKMLLDEGWVENDKDGKYIVGSRMMILARHLHGHWSENEILSPIIQDLAQACGHSACFARYANDSFVLTAKTEMPSSFHFIDLFFKAYRMIDNGMAMALLAFQSPDEVNGLLEEQTSEDNIDRELALFETIRKDGYHISEAGAVTRITAPVRWGVGHTVKGAVSVAAIGLERAKAEQILESVREAAAESERRLQHNALMLRGA